LLRLPVALRFAPCLLTHLEGSVVRFLLLTGMGIDKRLDAAGHVVIDLSLASTRRFGLQECHLGGLDRLLQRVKLALYVRAELLVVGPPLLVQLSFQTAEALADRFDVLRPLCIGSPENSCWSPRGFPEGVERHPSFAVRLNPPCDRRPVGVVKP